MTNGFDQHQLGALPNAPDGGGPNPYAPPRADLRAQPDFAVRKATAGDVLKTFSILFKRSLTTILGPYALIALASLVFVSVPFSYVSYLQTAANTSAPYGGGSRTMLVVAGIIHGAGVLWLVFFTLQTGLLRTLRVAAVDGVDAVGGLAGAFKSTTARFWPTLGSILMFGLAVFVGFLCCGIPALAAIFFLIAAMYYTAVRDAGVWDGIVRSYRMALRNAGTLAAALGLMIAGGLVMLVPPSVASIALQARYGQLWGGLAAQGVFMICGLPAGYLLWVFFGSGLIAIETAESGVPIKR